MTPSLSSAASSLRSAGINPTEEILVGIGEKILTGLWVHWSPISRETGATKLQDILGDGFTITWFPNLAEFYITLKK